MAVFAALPDNPTVRSIFQRTGKEEDLGLGEEEGGLIAEQGSSYITFTHHTNQPGSKRSPSDHTAAY